MYICKVEKIYLHLHTCLEGNDFSNLLSHTKIKTFYKCNKHNSLRIVIPKIAYFLKKHIDYFEYNNFEIDIEVYNVYKTLLDNEIEINLIKTKTENDYDSDWLSEKFNKLSLHQKIGVELIKKKKDYCLFWEQRTRKTATAIVALENINKIMIAVPNGLLNNWLNEWNIYGTKREIILLKGNIERRKKLYKQFNEAEKIVLIGSWPTLSNDILKYRWKPINFDYLIIDEAHFLRNDKTIQSRGLYKLRKFATNALILTATPATNNPSDIIPIIKLLFNCEISKSFIQKNFFEAETSYFSQYLQYSNIKGDQEEEWCKFLDAFSDGIKYKEVFKWAISTPKRTVYLDLNKQDLQRYNDMINDFVWYTNKNQKMYEENILTQYIKLEQICIDSNILTPSLLSNKTLWIKDFINKHKNLNIIIWSTSTKYLNFLKTLKEFQNAYLFTGETSDEERAKLTKKFQQNKGIIFLVNLRVGAEGRTWDNADYMIFVNRDWSYVKNDQADKRCLAIVKENINHKVEIIDLVVKDSIEEYKENVLKEKRSITSIVNEFNKYLQQRKEK